MLSFLKVFARGIICTVLLPVILLVWVLYGVYCLVAFLVMFVKSVILFFAGDDAAGELPEDKQAKIILMKREQAQFEQQQATNMLLQNMTVQQQMIQQAMNQQQGALQQPVFPQQPQQPQDGFDPFTPDPVPENPLPGTPDVEQQNNEEGGNDDGQSY